MGVSDAMQEAGNFKFYLRPRVAFGAGLFATAGAEAATLGRIALVVTGKGAMRRAGYTDRLLASLEAAGVKGVLYEGVRPNPTVDEVDAGATLARQERAEVVIGLGGGSAVDTAKAIAVTAASGVASCRSLLGCQLTKPGLPVIAVPTTSGTGAEVTAVAVVSVPEQGVKTALRGPGVMATVAVVDPELTLGLPPNVTASTGMDALAHAVESYLSVNSSPVSEFFAERAVGLILPHLAAACADGRDAAARSAMAEGSCLAGIALAQSGAALGHGFGMALGGPFDVDHGALVGRILPEMLEFSLPAVTDRLARLARRCEALPGLTAGGAGGPSASDADAAAALIKAIRDLMAEIPLPASLPAMGITRSALAGEAYGRLLELILVQAGTKNHPVPVDMDSAAVLLDRLLG